VALVGVVVGLFLQVRQLRINNLQTFKASHAGLIQMALDHPTAWADPTDMLTRNPDEAQRSVLLNWQFVHLQFGYLTGTLPESGLRFTVSELFVSPSRRRWWEVARKAYEAEIRSRRDRRFVEIVDGEYGRAVALNASSTSPEKSSGPTEGAL
jgi:hypothetical protein